MANAQVVSFCITKGGSGKTTSCVNMCTAIKLLDSSKKVCLIDFDPQANSCVSFGINSDKLDKTILSVITGHHRIEDVIIKTKYGVDIVPSNDDLSELDMIILNNKDAFAHPALVLKEAIKPLLNKYDYIMIDLPPSKGLLVINALSCSSFTILTMQCEYLATIGVMKMLSTIQKVKESYNPNLNLLGVIATMYAQGTNLSAIVLQEARRELGGAGIKVFDTSIYKTIKFPESTLLGVPAIIQFPGNRNVMDYIELTKEVFNIG